MRLCKFLISILIILGSSLGFAANSTWLILPNESNLTFTGTMNNAETSGKFTSLSGQVDFDQQNPTRSSIHVEVETDSVSTPYAEIANTLKTADWFNVKLFPKAIFDAKEVTKINDNTYQAKGTLTILDKSVPITVNFTSDELTANKVHVSGNTTVKRTQFGVGKGEWGDTSEVGDEVKIQFKITAIKK